ncbi:testis-specific serine/threonine-protein kinase 6-like [Salminus brasiliensis]|uniref:testis-specific serine/threonine-protein kinase 6-like n=1 Tax=Salminus brasiliensis TaxID=930266 RepID=UPI003B82CA2A
MQTKEVLRSLGYEVVDFIGKGSYGEVKLATSQRHSNHVAIKIMHRRLASHLFVSKLLPRELAILKRVKHPHIVQVHEIFEMPNGQVFIVMEAAAMDLQQKIWELGRIPIGQAKMWFSQLLSAVAYLHQQNIVHRDLKCKNVLLTANDQVKLTDFGLGRFSRGFPDLSKTYYCTPEYGAPEVLLEKPYDPKKSDVWSLGIIFYSMVTGSTPFKVNSLKSLLRVQREPLVFPRRITVEEPCRAFISYMLQYDPSTRPSVTEVAQHPWLQLRQERVIGRFVVVPVEDLCPDVNPLETSEEESQSSFSLNSNIDSISSSASENGLVFFSTPQSTEEESPSSSLSRDVDVLLSHGVRCETLMPEQKGDSNGAGASLTCQRVEAVEEHYGCVSCSPVCAAIKRAANAYVKAPILRASRSLRRRMRKLFRVNSVVHDTTSISQQSAPHSASPSDAHACLCSEQRLKDVTVDVPLHGLVVETASVLPQPTVWKGTRRLRFPKFKILKKTKMIHPL